LFEEFCNDHRLFISTPKSFVTVFHSSQDCNVVYKDNAVFVDGVPVVIKIYDQLIVATPTFKYLGVVLDSTCSFQAHAAARESAFERAAHLMCTGISRMPSYPHSFLLYLWGCLVKPAMNYGMELLALPSSYLDGFRTRKRKW